MFKSRNSFPYWNSFFLDGQGPLRVLGLMLGFLNPYTRQQLQGGAEAGLQL